METTKQEFKSWSFEQCVTLGNDIVAVKNDKGENVKWINTTTKEEFTLN